VAGGLGNSQIYVFDVGSDPARPRLVRTIGDFVERSGYVGPHTYYAMPGRMLVGALSNSADKGGATGMAVYNNKGEFVARYDMPKGEVGGVVGDGYGYDLAINPGQECAADLQFHRIDNYRRSLGEVVGDPAAMKRFGNTMVLWDHKAMKPVQILSVPGARWRSAGRSSPATTGRSLLQP